MSLAARLVGSTSKVSISSVVVTVPEVPFALRPVKETIAAVAGNVALTTPELALFITVVAPATVKRFAATPAKV
jgi:hypothetical protein